MSVVDVDVGGGVPPGDGDAAVLAECRRAEVAARRAEGELITALLEVERARVYLADGHRCLAAYGRGVHRWDKLTARSRRGLVKLSRRDARVVDRLLDGRVGVPQAHLIGRVFETPRVGVFVELFLDMFLEWAAMLDFADFEEQVRNWRLLVDQDGSDPARAHRDRSLRVGMSDHRYTVGIEGPAVDGVRLKAVLQRFEDIEWDLDWAHTVNVYGAEGASPGLMPRTAGQRRYDAFQNLLDHVQIPSRRPRTTGELDDLDLDDPDFDTDIADDGTVDDGTVDDGGTDDAAAATSSARSATGSRSGSGSGSGVGMVVNLIADVDTFLAALDRMFPSAGAGGTGGDRSRPFPVPFGPTRARSQSFDGDVVSPHDLVLAALAGQIRILLTGDDGQVIAMTRRSRFFTGPLRDAALATATRCGHAGCLVATSCLQVDHWLPDSHGGLTEIANSGGGACRHHNNWRYTTSAILQRHPDGRLTTHRADGTDIAPPD